MDFDPSHIVVFTDGSCYPNNGKGDGGWAFTCFYKNKSVVKYGWEPNSSNNAMECTAILRALQYVPYGSSPITVYTDSTYCKNVINSWAEVWEQEGWVTSSGTPVKNAHLIAELTRVVRAHRDHRELTVRWVRGHSGIGPNEVVDVSAGRARRLKETNWDESIHNRLQ